MDVPIGKDHEELKLYSAWTQASLTEESQNSYKNILAGKNTKADACKRLGWLSWHCPKGHKSFDS